MNGPSPFITELARRFNRHIPGRYIIQVLKVSRVKIMAYYVIRNIIYGSCNQGFDFVSSDGLSIVLGDWGIVNGIPGRERISFSLMSPVDRPKKYLAKRETNA